MAANALKKITAEAKRIRKAHPKTSWRSAVKKAGAKFRSGKLKPRKKRAVSGKSKPRRKRTVSKTITVRRKRRVAKRVKHVTVLVDSGKQPRKRRVYRIKRTRKGQYAGSRRISGRRSSGNMLKTIAIVGLGLGAIYMLTKSSRPSVMYIPTGNAVRNNQAQQIIAYAQAAGLAATQIASLINALNTRSDDQVSDMYNDVQSGSGAGLLV